MTADPIWRDDAGPAASDPPGGKPVGQLSSLDARALSAVVAMRMACAGEEGRQQLRTDMISVLGQDAGRRAADDLFTLLAALSGGRRKLWHHALTCPCLGADEAWFANLMATGLLPDREETLMQLSLMLTFDRAQIVSPLVQQTAAKLACFALRRENRALDRTVH